MEDFQQRTSNFELEKYATQMMISPLLHSTNMDPFKMKQRIENIENPLNPYSSYIKSHLNFSDTTPLFGAQKDEEFMLDHSYLTKVEEPHADVDHPRKISTNFDVFYDPQLQIQIPQDRNLQQQQILKNLFEQHEKFDYNNYVSRSRGPSFNLIDPVKPENLEGLFGEQQYFVDEAHQLHHKDANLLKVPNQNEWWAAGNPTTIVSNFLLNANVSHNPLDFNFHGFRNLLGDSKLPSTTDLDAAIASQRNSAGAAEIKAEEGSAVEGEDNKMGALGPKKSKIPKKKRKLNDGTELTINVKTEDMPESPTLRKTQSECKKKVYSITPNTNFLKLKITKLADKEGFEGLYGQARSATKKTKKSSKTPNNQESGCKLDLNNDCSQKLSLLDKDDRSTEVSSNMSANQSVKSDETMIGLSKSKSCCPDDLVNKNSSVKKSALKKDILNGIQLPSDIEDFLNHSNLLNQIQFPTVRKIGTLTVEERRAKIEKYLQKRKKRTWNKKISYDCRKKVADSRLRIKGRFVTKEQAVAMLGGDGIYDLDKITSSEIKDLLNLKFGPSITKKKDPLGSPDKDGKINLNENSSIDGELSNTELKKEDNIESEELKKDDQMIMIPMAVAMKMEECLFQVMEPIETKIETI
jgi:hypothetical protein